MSKTITTPRDAAPSTGGQTLSDDAMLSGVFERWNKGGREGEGERARVGGQGPDRGLLPATYPRRQAGRQAGSRSPIFFSFLHPSRAQTECSRVIRSVGQCVRRPPEEMRGSSISEVRRDIFPFSSASDCMSVACTNSA